MNVLLTCGGRRNYLVGYFKEALPEDGSVFVTDAASSAPALQEADRGFVVPRVDDPDYVDVLLEICRNNAVDLLVSLNDLELPVLADARRGFLEADIVPAVSEPEVVDIAFDKWRTVSFLQRCGLTPPWTVLKLSEALKDLENGCIDFPLVVKPRWGSASVSIEVVRDKEELEIVCDLVPKRLRNTSPLLVREETGDNLIIIQDYLDGDEYGLDIINDLDGHNVTTFVKRKIKMRAGETDRAVTVDNADLLAIGGYIGENLGHVGNLDCDVFLTPDGPRVLELNPRFGGGYPFSHEAGADLPAMLLAWASGEEPKSEWLEVQSGLTFAKCDRLVKKTICVEEH